MTETKRDVAPPGWFRRILTAIDRAMDFCCGVLFCYLGGAGLLIFGPTVLDFGFEDASISLANLIGLAISAVFLLIGFWLLREWRRDRAGR